MKSHYRLGFFSTCLIILLFSACAVMPKGAQPIHNFDANRYLGKWYEVARIDNRFEKDLQQVTAEYSLNQDSSIAVVNRGYDTIKKKWKSVKGKAKFRSERTIAALKVSFFGPFYAGYNVIALDPEYQYALVAGKNFKYLWILSRQTNIPEDIKATFIKAAQDVGYDTNKLMWIRHEKELVTSDEKK